MYHKINNISILVAYHVRWVMALSAFAFNEYSLLMKTWHYEQSKHKGAYENKLGSYFLQAYDPPSWTPTLLWFQ